MQKKITFMNEDGFRITAASEYWERLLSCAVHDGLNPEVAKFNIEKIGDHKSKVKFHEAIMKKMPVVMKMPDVRKTIKVLKPVSLIIKKNGITVADDPDLSVVSLLLKRIVRIIIEEEMPEDQKRLDSVKNRIRNLIKKSCICLEPHVCISAEGDGIMVNIEMPDETRVNKRVPGDLAIFAEDEKLLIKKVESFIDKVSKKR